MSWCPKDCDAAVGGQEHVEPEVEAAVGQPGQQGGLRAQGEPVQDPRILQTHLRSGHYWYWALVTVALLVMFMERTSSMLR